MSNNTSYYGLFVFAKVSHANLSIKSHSPISKKLQNKSTISDLLRHVRDAVQFVLDVFKASNLCLGFFQVESSGIVGVKLVNKYPFGVTFLEELIIVEVAVIGRNAIEVTHAVALAASFLERRGSFKVNQP